MDITNTVSVQRRLRQFVSFNRMALVAACSLPLAAGCGVDQADDFDNDEFDSDRIVEIANQEETCNNLANRRGRVFGTVCNSIDNTVDTSTECGEAGATGVMNITYTVEAPWELVKTHVAVGQGLEDIPASRRGRIKHKWFPYIDEGLEGTTSHTVTVPLCELDLDASMETCDPVKAHVVARAKIRKQRNNGKWRYKRAWADGQSLGSRHRRGKFYTVELECNANPAPPTAECETAYAYSAANECFLGADFDGDGNNDGNANWGWTLGPIAPFTTTQLPVYAAVGGCDPTNGTHVGNLAVDYDGSSATVTFDHVGDVTLDEEQLYIGSGPLPLDANGDQSTNPADFPIAVDLEDATTTTHTVSGLSGDIHLIYHALACGDGLTPPQDPLSVMSDEFDADSLADWNIYNPQSSDVAVAGGEMELLPNLGAWWFGTDEAVHVSKSVSGDFAITAKVDVTNLADGPTVPGAPYRIGGIMLRDPNAPSGLPNTYHMGIGNMNTGVVTAVSKSTDEGYSDVYVAPTTDWPNDPNWNGTEADVRLCRVGDEVAAYARTSIDEPWTKISSAVRADLPHTLSAGPIGYTGFDQEDLKVLVDYVEFKQIDHQDDCFAQ